MSASTVTSGTIAQGLSGLDSVLADVKYRVGQFLANEKVILDARTRIESLLNAGIPQVKTNAQALAAKADALLKIQRDTEAQAQALLAQAGELKTRVTTTDLYSFLKTPLTYWGLRQYELVGDLLKQVTSLTTQSASLTARMLRQNTDVKTLTGEVSGTERAAAGQGFVPQVRGLLSGTVGQISSDLSKLVWPVAIAAAAGLLIYTGGLRGLLGKRS